MTDPRALHKAAVEAARVAISLDLKEQLGGKPLPGPVPPRADSWSALGDLCTVDMDRLAAVAIRAYLAALAAAGWKVVPREATEGMAKAGTDHIWGFDPDRSDAPEYTTDIYAAMHDAAPEWPPVNDESD